MTYVLYLSQLVSDHTGHECVSVVDAVVFSDCVGDVDTWMDCNRLQLNTDKTQII